MQTCELPLRKWERILRLKSGIRKVRLLRLHNLPFIILLVTLICVAFFFKCTATFPRALSHQTVVANSINATTHSTRAFHPFADSSIHRTRVDFGTVDGSNSDETRTNPGVVEESRSSFFEKRYRSIFFLKTHKTGSSTMSELIILYTQRHNLTIFYGPGDHLFETPNSGDAVYDAIVAHHFIFDWSIVNSYLRQPASLVLTNIRLPLQRQLSWFRQQNRELDNLTCVPIDTPRKNRNVSLILQKFDSFFKGNKQLGSQFDLLRESSVPRNALNEAGIINQFTFVVLRERFIDSLECLCRDVGIRLCDQGRNGQKVKSKNVSRKSTCVEAMLLKYRPTVLIKSSARDMVMYEIVNDRLNKCMQNIPEACKCPR